MRGHELPAQIGLRQHFCGKNHDRFRRYILIRPNVMGRHLRNLIRYVHAFDDFTKHRIAEIALAMIEEGVIRNIDKELAASGRS